MEYLPINQQLCGHQLMLLFAPLLNHLVPISYISFFDHNIFYGILTLSYYSLEPFDMPIVTWNVVSEHNFDGMFVLIPPLVHLSLCPKEVLEFIPNIIKKYGLNPVTGEIVQF